jgi:hypothetical protein
LPRACVKSVNARCRNRWAAKPCSTAVIPI